MKPELVMTLVSLFVAAGLYAWSGVTLGKVFRALGGAPGKAWVPVVGQVEMLRLAGRPAWQVIVLLVVPGFNLVVYYQVLRELTRMLGRPERLALIGVVVLPIWAGAVVAGGATAPKGVAAQETTGGSRQLGVDSLFGLSPSSQPGAVSPYAAPVAYPAAGCAAPVDPALGYAPPGPQGVPHACPAAAYPEPAVPVAAQALVPAQQAAPVFQPVPAQAVAPQAVGQPVAAQPFAVQPVVAPPVAVQPVALPPAAVPPAVVGQPVPSVGQQAPVLLFPPPVQDSPWSTPPGHAEPSSVTPAAPGHAVPAPAVAPVPASAGGARPVPNQTPGPRPEPVPQPQPTIAQPVMSPEAVPVSVVAPQPAPPSKVPTPQQGTARPALKPVPSPEPGFDASDHTVVIDRVSTRPWALVLEDGRSFDLWASSVVVGREPTATDMGVQMLAIPDDTKTISKMHARFDLVDGVWQVTDLGSTNGIVVTGTDGRAFSVRSGRTSVVGNQLVLGSVAMRLVPRQSLARSA